MGHQTVLLRTAGDLFLLLEQPGGIAALHNVLLRLASDLFLPGAAGSACFTVGCQELPAT